MNSQRGLLLDTLHRNKSHGRTADGLADRLRVAAVVFVALQIRLHICRRHQSHVMAITADHPRPVVRGTTGLNSHGAWRKLRAELLHRAAPKLATQHNGSRSINYVNLKHVLRQIQTNCANLAHGRLPCLVESTSPVWHTDAVGGRPPHHCEERSAEAIQLCGSKLDCFAALAMTAGSAHSSSSRYTALPHCEERSDEAIQLCGSQAGLLRCA